MCLLDVLAVRAVMCRLHGRLRELKTALVISISSVRMLNPFGICSQIADCCAEIIYQVRGFWGLCFACAVVALAFNGGAD